ncbi:hypothetical protein [Pantoea stewartii]|uniref:hypothetical protein n=1 Tax=Pantoea stewartii TaxID=66269 RepID=UPI00345BA918
MSAINTLREMSEVWNLFGDMPDDATLGVDLAALYLGISVKTLARYRQNGDGSPYVQYQSSDSKARNQRVNYLLGDLRAWRNGHRVKSTMQAAQVRGLTFTSISDLICPQPFWKADDRGFIEHAFRVTDEDFKTYLNNLSHELIWISLEQALLETWANVEARNQWHLLYIEVLNEAIKASVALQEKHELDKVII